MYPDRPLSEADPTGDGAPFPMAGASCSGPEARHHPGDRCPGIIAAAQEADAAVEIVVPIGEMVHAHTPIAVVHGAAASSLDSVVVKAIRTGAERTFEQDPALAFRVLVDIALRALSRP